MKPLPEPQPHYIENLLWVPGQGVDQEQLRSLEGLFGRPWVVLGEDWFIGESQEGYRAWSERGIEDADARDIGRYLCETIGSIYYYPEMPEYGQWYGYFTPRILNSPQFEDEKWVEILISGLLGLSWLDPESEVIRHEAAFARVLASVIMEARFWNGGYFRLLWDGRRWPHDWRNAGINGSISTSMLFAWRYLAPGAVGAWLHSVLAIEDVLWRAHFLVWIHRVAPILRQNSSNYEVLKECDMEGLWGEFDRMNRRLKNSPERRNWNLIPTANIVAFRNAIRGEFDEGTYFAWIDQMSSHAELWKDMEWWLEQFQTNFLER